MDAAIDFSDIESEIKLLTFALFFNSFYPEDYYFTALLSRREEILLIIECLFVVIFVDIDSLSLGEYCLELEDYNSIESLLKDI